MKERKPTIKEKDIQKVILEYLKLRKIFAWRQNSGAFKTDAGGFYWIGIIGAPDIFILRKSIIYACEVKNEKGKQSESQKAFQEQFEKAGGVYFIARTLEDVIKKLSPDDV